MNLINTMAHRYLKLGWSVIPIKYKSKEPAIKSWKEYQTRLPTTDELNSWFEDGKMANLALITGSISKVSIVDADGLEGIKSLSELKLLSSVQAMTGRGKHLFYSDPEGKAKNFVKRYPGLDARGEGGYVLVYPSIHESGTQYRWVGSFESVLPEFPVALLTEKKEPETAGKIVLDSPLSQTQRLQMLEKALPLLKQERSENYDSWIKVGMALKEFGIVGYRLWNTFSQRSSKYSEQICADKWRTFNDESGITIGSIIFWAKEDSGQSIRPEPSQSKPIDRQSHITFSPNGNLSEHKQRLLSKSEYKGPELSTGMPILDRHTWGLVRGEIFTVAARTGVGKTSFATGLVKQLVSRGKHVLFFSTEMSSELIVNRLLSSYTGINGDAFRTGSFTAEDRQKLDDGYTWLEGIGSRLTICDLSGPSIEVVKGLTEKHKPDVVVFDHIQHIGGGNDVRHTISEFIRGLKDIARNFNCAVLVLSQLRRMFRDYKTGLLPAPQLSDLKESGTIEEESGQVLLLSEMSTEPGTSFCLLLGELAKNRFGECTRVGIEFDRSTAQFKEIINAEMPEV
jgi:KaiC/GvpD/RAD55 family RecA-like ATPase